jgi:uncharacterized DUF497 family protein
MINILPEPLEFEWDRGNIDKNWRKHQVSGTEAEETFVNKPLFVFEDAKHSIKSEKRHFCLGKTNRSRLLFISFTVREEHVRVISARDMNKKERKTYAVKKNI